MKGQGSLEYLIIVGVVIAIAGLVVYFGTGIFAGQKEAGSFSFCKQVASECKSARLLTPNEPCPKCETACVDGDGNDLMSLDPVDEGYNTEGSAVYYCKLGTQQEIAPVGTGNATGGGGGGGGGGGTACDSEGTVTCASIFDPFSQSECDSGSCPTGQTCTYKPPATVADTGFCECKACS